MNQDMDVDIPHQLGREEAKRRIAGNTHKLADKIPGGVAEVHEAWDGDVLTLTVGAMGQQVIATITVMDALVRCHMELPPMLAMFKGAIENAFRKHGDELLLEDRSKG